MVCCRHDSPLFDFIESCLRNKHEMVVYEAASAIVHMPNCTARELAPAVSGRCVSFCCLCSFLYKTSVFFHLNPALSFPLVLQLFCSSPKAALRYAAVRTLNKVSPPFSFLCTVNPHFNGSAAMNRNNNC